MKKEIKKTLSASNLNHIKYNNLNHISDNLNPSIEKKMDLKSLISLKKVLSIKGGQFTKNTSNNSTQTVVEIQEGGNNDNTFDINSLNRAKISKNEKVISGNQTGRTLKDIPAVLKPDETITIEREIPKAPILDMKPEIPEGPLIRPEVVNFPDFKPERIEKTPVDFKYIIDNLNKEYKDKNVDEIMKEIYKIREANAIKEIARKKFIEKQYDKMHIKKFARDNLRTRAKFIPLPLSNKEIFEAFIVKNNSTIEYFSYFLNSIFLFLYLQIFKFIIIRNCSLIRRGYKDKKIKNCIKPIIRLVVILLNFLLILSFNSRLIKFIMTKLFYIYFIYLKNETKIKINIDLI